MDISLAPQRIFVLDDALTADDLRQRAMDRRAGVVAGGLGGLLQRPRPDDVALVGSQRRLDPFWHVACRARYVYERTRDYAVPASAAEVVEATVNGTTYVVAGSGKGGRTFTLSVREGCREEFRREVFVDGSTGQPVTDAATIVGRARHEVDDPAALSDGGTVVRPLEHRGSSVIRQLLADMLRPLQADVVTEEALALELTDLYYRPVWAFEFAWAAKGRTGVIEIDAVTGQVRNAPSLTSGLTKVVSRDALFDIGADTVGLLVPGGSIAVKVARVALDKGY